MRVHGRRSRKVLSCCGGNIGRRSCGSGSAGVRLAPGEPLATRLGGIARTWLSPLRYGAHRLPIWGVSAVRKRSAPRHEAIRAVRHTIDDLVRVGRSAHAVVAAALEREVAAEDGLVGLQRFTSPAVEMDSKPDNAVQRAVQVFRFDHLRSRVFLCGVSRSVSASGASVQPPLATRAERAHPPRTHPLRRSHRTRTTWPVSEREPRTRP